MTSRHAQLAAPGRPPRTRRDALALFAPSFLAIFGASHAGAQAPTEPGAAIARIYKGYASGSTPGPIEDHYSARLRQLAAAARKRTPDGDIGPLDFDPVVNGQDWEIKRLRIREIKREADRAIVQASFTNFGDAKEIVFDLVRGPSGWKIDDITSRRNPRWTLSRILAGRGDASSRRR